MHVFGKGLKIDGFVRFCCCRVVPVEAVVAPRGRFCQRRLVLDVVVRVMVQVTETVASGGRFIGEPHHLGDLNVNFEWNVENKSFLKQLE